MKLVLPKPRTELKKVFHMLEQKFGMIYQRILDAMEI